MNVVKRILSQADLKILDVQMNAVNGGSFAITAAKSASELPQNHAVIDWLLRQEEDAIDDDAPALYETLRRVYRHRDDLSRLINSLNASGKSVLGYGASTKGRVLLQFCNFTPTKRLVIAEVNEDKFGYFCPGTQIPIISESEAREMAPDYFLVLPWHFKPGILGRSRTFWMLVAR